MRRALDVATGAAFAAAYLIGRAVRLVRRLAGWVRFALGALACRMLGHKHERAGTVTVRGWRPAVLVVCTRCGRSWRGVRS